MATKKRVLIFKVRARNYKVAMKKARKQSKRKGFTLFELYHVDLKAKGLKVYEARSFPRKRK